MDYKKKYEDALLAMKQRVESGVIDECYAEEIFPELKESEDERIRKSLIKMLKNDEKCYLKEIAWLEKQGEKKPAEWSDIDLICLGYLADFVDKNGDEFYGTNKSNVVKWIRSFANLPQPQQEWNEEDEKMIENIIDTINMSIEDCDVDDVGTKARFTLEKEREWLKNRLKSLRPQSIWKPSEEMLEALYRAIPNNVMAISEDEMLLDKLYKGLKYGRILS